MQTVEEFLKSGGVVVVGKYHGPRKSEKTFANTKYSIANVGHQAVALARGGLYKRSCT